MTYSWQDQTRKYLAEEAKKLLGIPYEFGANWTDHTVLPKSLDCSEATRGICIIVAARIGLPEDGYLPDGSQNQFKETIPVEIKDALPGDFFFAGKEGNVDKIYHVGMLYDASTVWEARAFDKDAAFETGKVILRDRTKWESYKNFVGYRRLKALA